MDQSRQRKLALIAVALGWMVAVLLGQASIEPGFFTRNFIAILWADLQSLPLTINILSNVPGMKPWLSIVTLVTGIPLGEIHRLPFGALVRALLYAVIVRRITNRLDLSAGIALVTLVYPWAGWGYHAMFVHSLGGFLFLSLVLLVVIMGDDRHRPSYSMVGVGLLIALFLFDYTASAWSGIMLVSLVGVAHYCRALRRSGVIILALCAGILYSLKTTIASFAALWQGESPINVITAYFAPEVAESTAYQYTPGDSGLGLSKVIYLLIAIALTAYGLALGWTFYRQRDFPAVLSRISTQEYVIGTALFGGAIGTGLYTFMDRFTQFFIFLMGPLTGVLAVWYLPRYLPRLREYQTIIVAVFILLLMGFIGMEFAYQMHSGDIDQNSDADGASTGAWLATHTTDPTVQTDLTTAGRMRLAEEQHDGQFNWQWYDEKSYAAVVEQGNPDAEYTVIDTETEVGVRAIGGWANFESFGQYEQQINANTNMNRVYCDGTHTVFR